MEAPDNKDLIEQIIKWAEENWVYYRTVSYLMDAILNKFDSRGNLSNEEEESIRNSVSDFY